ncbi:hypothetical protein [Nonomuraea lactucae]|uniref:hypothetical protein n=1 Tax=Nonomuraea lactucae TaxID=2249762 RepID=UPI0013B41069|nr:hypothetical protein [Nonomuraea lactucae]
MPAVATVTVLLITGVSVLVTSSSSGPPARDSLVPAAASTQARATTTPPPSVAPPSSDPATEPPLGDIPEVTKSKIIAMPLDPYMTPMEDIELIAKARSLAARDCMHALGYKEWKIDTVPMAATTSYKEADLIDYVDPAEAGKSGYPGISPRQPLIFDRRAATTAGPSQEALDAYMGKTVRTTSGISVPAGGCAEDGDRKVRATGTTNVVTELPVDPRDLAAESRFSALRDSRMRTAFLAWSSCMAGNGMRYAEPSAARHDPRWAGRRAESPAGEDEKRVAQADGLCQQKVNLVGTYKALQAAYQKEMIGKHESALATVPRIFRGWVENAERIVAKG